jgi:hypothetical protein
MQLHDNCIFRELESPWAFRARSVITAVTGHKML